MPELQINIVDKADGAAPWGDIATRIDPADSQAGTARAAILQAGMGSGAPSIMLAIPIGERFVTWQTSAAILRALVAALNGAEERWADA